MDQLSPLGDFPKNKKEESYFYFPRMYPNFWPNSSSDDRFSTSDQKDIYWFYFISSTSLVMSTTTLFFRWREEPMISFSRNF
ncbi:hypothetical protein Lal_00033864 [Lupinus albus]|nr:hypothetical protein Lal_00033864 [Lupinus albus]